MADEKRKTGIDIIDDAPWGMHFCQFYQTKEDLLSILVPYFKAGLENNEFCMWITSEPLTINDAKEALRKAVPDFDRFVNKGQIDIIPHDSWYLKDGIFELKRVFNAWIDKLNNALAKGYDGMRVTGNTGWLEKNDWQKFKDYEEEINRVICGYKMLVICTYSLDKCGAHEILDVVANHQFALIKGDGKWKIIESSERKRTEEVLRGSEARYRALFERSADGILIVDLETKVFKYANPAVCRMLGYTADELRTLGVVNIHPKDALPYVMAELGSQIGGEKTLAADIPCRRKDGTTFYADSNATTIAIDGRKCLVGFFRDVTERKQAETEIAKQLDELRRWQTATLGREGRILEVKKEVNELLERLGEPPRYGSVEAK